MPRRSHYIDLVSSTLPLMLPSWEIIDSVLLKSTRRKEKKKHCFCWVDQILLTTPYKTIWNKRRQKMFLWYVDRVLFYFFYFTPFLAEINFPFELLSLSRVNWKKKSLLPYYLSANLLIHCCLYSVNAYIFTLLINSVSIFFA